MSDARASRISVFIGRTTPLTCPGRLGGYMLGKAHMRPGSGAAPGYSSWPRWDGRKPVPRVVGLKACLAQRGTFRQDAPADHDAGSGPTHPKETTMRFYTEQHRFYAGVDLHARTLSLCVLDQA